MIVWVQISQHLTLKRGQGVEIRGPSFTFVLKMVKLPNNLFTIHQSERSTGLPPGKIPCRYGFRLGCMQQLSCKQKTSGHGNCRYELFLDVW